MATYVTLKKQHELLMRELNTDVVRQFPSSISSTLWAEGGEWPAYRDEYQDFKIRPVERDLDPEFTLLSDVKAVGDFIDKALSTDTVVGLSLPCGAGKSTEMMVKLHALKYAARTIVVQPSMVVAWQLAEYVRSVRKQTAGFATHITSEVKGLVYVGIGTLLDALLMGTVTDDDLIVIDEAHSVSFVHELVNRVLSSMSCVVIQLTASTTPHVQAIKGVRLIKADVIDGESATVIGKAKDKAIVVGVGEGSTYGASAAMLIGATVRATVVFDTGLRPEPRVRHGALVPGERKATIGEIVQMVGRVGRDGKGGVAYYNDDARVLTTRGNSLYDVMHTVIKITIGVITHRKITKDQAVMCWKSSGLVDFSTIKPKQEVAVEAAAPKVASVASSSKDEGDHGVAHDEVPQSQVKTGAGKQKGGSTSVLTLDDAVANVTLGDKVSEHGAAIEKERMKRSQVQDDEALAKALAAADEDDQQFGEFEEVLAEPSGRHRRDSSGDTSRSYTSASSQKDGASIRGDRAHGHSRRGSRVSQLLSESTSSSGSLISGSGSHGEAGVKTHMHKRQGKGVMKMTSGIISDHQGMQVGELRPDANWRPFRRVDELTDGEKQSDTGIMKYIDWVKDAVRKGDAVVPAPFPRADKQSTTDQSRYEARLVLSGQMLPTYSELELLSVVVWWNDVARGTRQYMPQKTVWQFLDYFESFATYCSV